MTNEQPSTESIDPVAYLQQRAKEPGGSWIVDLTANEQVNEPANEPVNRRASGRASKQADAEPSLAEAIAQQALAIKHWLLNQSHHQSHCPKPESGDLPHAPTLLLMLHHGPSLLAWWSAAVSAGVPVFLGNPQWSPQELRPILEQIAPTLLVGTEQVFHNACNNFSRLSGESHIAYTRYPQNFLHSPQVFHSFPQICGKLNQSGQSLAAKGNHLKSFCLQQGFSVENSMIFIPTGGSSGKLRFAHHSWQTLLASVAGLRQSNLLAGETSIDSFCLLPLHHVSGLMQFVRSLTSGGRLAIAQRKLSPVADITPESFFISLVPTQLQRALHNPETAAWLARFRTVLLGGAPAWPSLLTAARQANIRLAPTYGMTETASQVVTMAPQDFAAGHSGCGQVLPHAQVEICDASGQPLPVGQTGQVRVRSRSLALGYLALSQGSDAEKQVEQQNSQAQFHPLPRDAQGSYLMSDDLGFFDEAGFLHIVGRSSDKIISGGENVFPAEVEAAILATGLVADVIVLGVQDGDWGERVVALWEPSGAEVVTSQELSEAIAPRLSPAKRPKDWIQVEKLPRNAQGKINRSVARTLVRGKAQDQATSSSSKS